MERTVDDLLRHEETLLSALTERQRAQLGGLLRTLLRDLTRRRDADQRPPSLGDI